MAAKKTVSGRAVIIGILSAAAVLWLILYFLADSRRQRQREEETPAPQSTLHRDPDAMRRRLSGLPREWVRITRVAGQGYVIYVPCEGRVPVIELEPAAPPSLRCLGCEALAEARIAEVHGLEEGGLLLVAAAPAESLRILPVTPSLLRRFPEAPFQDMMLLWVREGGRDTLVFTPREREMEFETRREEDESPEGCVGSGDLP